MLNAVLVVVVAAIALGLLVIAGSAVLFGPRFRRSREYARETTGGTRGALFDHNPDAVFELDLSGNFVSANSATEEISGYRAEELVGGHFGNLLSPGELETTLGRFTGILEVLSQTYETQIIHKVGHQVPISVTNVPILFGDGVSGAQSSSYRSREVRVAAVRDITERKRAERVIRRQSTAIQSSIDGMASTPT